MSVRTAESLPVTPASSDTPPTGILCGGCGAALAEDQEWCLECGAARTQLHAPPGWRVPIAVIAVVVAVVVVALVIALINLSINANHLG